MEKAKRFKTSLTEMFLYTHIYIFSGLIYHHPDH